MKHGKTHDGLVEKVENLGRIVEVTTYLDGATPLKARLIFWHPKQAEEFCRVLNEAKDPVSK